MEDIRFKWLLGELRCIHQEMQAGMYLQKANRKYDAPFLRALQWCSITGIA